MVENCVINNQNVIKSHGVIGFDYKDRFKLDIVPEVINVFGESFVLDIFNDSIHEVIEYLDDILEEVYGEKYFDLYVEVEGDGRYWGISEEFEDQISEDDIISILTLIDNTIQENNVFLTEYFQELLEKRNLLIAIKDQILSVTSYAIYDDLEDLIVYDPNMIIELAKFSIITDEIVLLGHHVNEISVDDLKYMANEMFPWKRFLDSLLNWARKSNRSICLDKVIWSGDSLNIIYRRTALSKRKSVETFEIKGS